MFQLEEVTSWRMNEVIKLNPNYHIVCCACIGYTISGMIAERIGITARFRHLLHYAADSANHRKVTTNLFPIARLSLIPIDTAMWANTHPKLEIVSVITLTEQETYRSIIEVFRSNEHIIQSNGICFYLEKGYCNINAIRNILIALQNDSEFKVKYPSTHKVYLACPNA